MIEIISLKTYWYCEGKEIKNVEQEKHNEWIDQILSESFRISDLYPGFSVSEKKAIIEFGDYLVLYIIDNFVYSFAVCVDYPSSTWDIWLLQNHLLLHGMIEISMIESRVPGAGAVIIEEIKQFSRKILLRKRIEITVSIKDPKLVAYYKKLKFVKSKKQKITTYQRMVFANN